MVYALLPVLLVGLVCAVGLAGYGFGTLGRFGFRRAGRDVRLRCLAALLAAGAVAVYTWGLVVVGLTALDASDGGADSAPVRPCRSGVPRERALHVVDYTVDYVPLRFVCETDEGADYAADAVPGYVNPAALALAATATVALAATTATARSRRGPGERPAA
jgi:hypothetical protein